METLPASARRFVLAVVVSGWTTLAVTLCTSAGTVLSPRSAAVCVVLVAARAGGRAAPDRHRPRRPARRDHGEHQLRAGAGGRRAALAVDVGAGRRRGPAGRPGAQGRAEARLQRRAARADDPRGARDVRPAHRPAAAARRVRWSCRSTCPPRCSPAWPTSASTTSSPASSSRSPRASRSWPTCAATCASSSPRPASCSASRRSSAPRRSCRCGSCRCCCCRWRRSTAARSSPPTASTRPTTTG